MFFCVFFPGLNDVEKFLDKKPWYGRYKNWKGDAQPCAKERVHSICILSTGMWYIVYVFD